MTYFWMGVIVAAVSLYVLLDGFDLGVGILFGFTRNESCRTHLIRAIAPVWDGNETWLVMTGAALFGAFPVVYSVVLSAFYLPICIMLAALIMRGVSFEFRHQAVRTRWLWDAGFFLGSLLATFIQGVAIGALAKGLPVENGQYVGSAFTWLSPFSVLCGVGLTLGYTLLGTAWLIHKSKGSIQYKAQRLVPWLVVSVCSVLLLIFLAALDSDAVVLARWSTPSWRYLFPTLGGLAAISTAIRPKKAGDHWQLLSAMAMFCTGIGALASSFWPYMVPYSITIEQGAAPAESLSFMFWGIGIIVFPLTLGYAAMNYSVFRGKLIRHDSEY